MKYDRLKAVSYAKKYALTKNPKYYFFDGIGGDCTNFVSQCLYEGGFNMVYDDIDGWFYVNSNFRSASWTGVEYFRNFILDNTFLPYGLICNAEDVTEGDIIFLNNGEKFYHSLIITKIENDEIYVSSHSFPALDKNLKSYKFLSCDFVHIVD